MKKQIITILFYFTFPYTKYKHCIYGFMGQSSRCGGAWFLATSPPSGAADLWWGASHDRCHDAWRRVTCHEWRQLQMLASLLTISLSPSDQMMQCPCPLLYFTLYDISTNIRFSRLKLSSHQCQCHFVCVFSPSVFGTVFLSVVLSINLFDSVCALFG